MSRYASRAIHLRDAFLAVLVAAVLTAADAGAEALLAEGADTLWARAVALVAANDDWTPGSTVFAGREIDGSGRTRSSWEVSLRTTPNATGETAQEVVRYVENGKDVTAERRARPTDRGRGRQSEGGGPFSWNPSDPRQLPLHPTMQARVSVRRMEGDAFAGGKHCARYSFRQRLEGRDFAVGTILIETSSGAPVEMEASYDPLPAFVSRAELALEFASDGDGTWKVRSFRATGEGTFLLIKRTFTMEFDLAEHWRLPVAAR